MDVCHSNAFFFLFYKCFGFEYYIVLELVIYYCWPNY